MENVGSYIEYTGAKDNTITGSRNGLSPLFLWHELNCAKEGKFEKLIQVCIGLAGYAIQKFDEHGIRAWRNKHSLIVIFPRPSEKLIRKWQLAIEGDIAHLVALPHLNHKIIDSIVAQVALDLKRRRKSPKKR